jgi:8-oxo-dGTP pyrophosphatase MutT (NUDIX family)
VRTPAWLTRARAAAQQDALRPRLPLLVAGLRIGSVEDEVLAFVADLAPALPLQREDTPRGPVWQLDCAPEDITTTLNELAQALREANLCGPWRDEQLGVLGPAARRLGTIERGAVRVLGLATQAVHLVGLAPDGRHWVQQRAHDKPNDPGLWDTLMGGMVSAADTLHEALARETWEEAGLHVEQMTALSHGGHVEFARPSAEGGGCGYMVERIDWFVGQVPDGRPPENQDGEVAQFALLTREELLQRVAAGEFTLEASLIIAASLGL